MPAPKCAVWKRRLSEIGGTLVFLPHNPLDRLWTDRPAEPLGAVSIQNVAQAGVLARDKIATDCRRSRKEERLRRC